MERPDDLSLIGQDEPLRAALDRRSPAQALLIIGAPGSGRGRFAEVLAQAAVCGARRPGGLPCGACAACTTILAGTHPDLHWLAAQDHLGIDEIRQVRAEAFLRPVEACALFVLEHAERLTDQAAAALLKTLEDPPGPARFFLVAEHRDQVQSTLLSRCMPLRLRPVPVSVIADWLAQVRPGAPAEARLRAARWSRGLPGRALALLAEPDAATEQAAGELVAAAAARGAGAIVTHAGTLAKAGRLPQELLLLSRDACARATGALSLDAPGLSGSPEAAAGLAGMGDPAAFAEFGWRCLEAARAHDANVNATLNWQVLLSELQRTAVSR